MNEEQLKANRLKWIEELESGKWAQVRGAWRDPRFHMHQGNEGKHCCLDVANCIFAADRDYNGTDQFVYKQMFKEVTAEALGIGMDSDNSIPGSFPWFTNLNDVQKYTFAEIAAEARSIWNLPMPKS